MIVKYITLGLLLWTDIMLTFVLIMREKRERREKIERRRRNEKASNDTRTRTVE